MFNAARYGNKSLARKGFVGECAYFSNSDLGITKAFLSVRLWESKPIFAGVFEDEFTLGFVRK